jgi:hypothetical protein
MDMTVFLEPKLDLEKIAKTLDELGDDGRVHTIRGWNKATQAALFEALADFRPPSGPLTMDHFVPSSAEPLSEHIHEGKNTLPLFSHFQKRFTRTEGGKLVGYNHGATMGFTGPGYFSVRDGDREGEIAIDYTLLPTERVPSWPEILPNSARLGSLVWGGMVDHMRGLSQHVSIGRAAKGGKMMDAWFVLCRLENGPLLHG